MPPQGSSSWPERGRPVPASIRALQGRARRLEGWSIVAMVSVIAVMIAAGGGSQAMKAAWAEDALALVPSIAYLVGSRLRARSSSHHYPFGYGRSLSIAFLAAATALLIFGAYIVSQGVRGFFQPSQPLGTRTLFGFEIWSGWIMIAALTYSAIPPILLGRRKLELARALQEKTLHTDATMMRDDWLTALAAAVGILGLRWGWAWVDAAAASLIGLQVVKDGVEHFREAVAVLADRRPTTANLEGEDPLVEAVRERARERSRAEDVRVRLRESGDRIVGEVHLFGAPGADLRAVRDAILDLHWRLGDVLVVPALADLHGISGGEPGGERRHSGPS